MKFRRHIFCPLDRGLWVKKYVTGNWDFPIYYAPFNLAEIKKLFL